MSNEILDDGIWARTEIKNKADLKKALMKGGINSFYEHKNGAIIVEQGDAVKVAIHYENEKVSIKPKFPRIGNSVQVIVSGIILAVFLFLIPIPFPLPWIIAIIGGQALSYFVYYPKTIELKERIEKSIMF